MPTLEPTDLGAGKLKGDYEVLDEHRRSIGRIMLHPQAPSGITVVLVDYGALPAEHA